MQILPDNWLVLIEPTVMAKLQVWDTYRNELQGLAWLDTKLNADPDQPYVFHIIDIDLAPELAESTPGYTEMTPAMRVKLLMQGKERGYSALQSVWWHKHPIHGWSGTDVNTARGKLQEVPLGPKRQGLSIVKCPSYVLARWDQVGINSEDNVWAAPVVWVGGLEILDTIRAAELALKDFQANHKESTIVMPEVSWTRKVVLDDYDDEILYTEQEMAELAEDDWGDYPFDPWESDTLQAHIMNELQRGETEYDLQCRRKPERVSVDWCLDCLYVLPCFGLTYADLEDKTLEVYG